MGAALPRLSKREEQSRVQRASTVALKVAKKETPEAWLLIRPMLPRFVTRAIALRAQMIAVSVLPTARFARSSLLPAWVISQPLLKSNTET
jgi:hypothetical protein